MAHSSWRPLRVTALAALWVAAGCAYQVEIGSVYNQPQRSPVRLDRLAQVDLLLVIDDSPSMAKKQQLFADALRTAAPSIDAWGSVHVAAITTDLGAGSQALAMIGGGHCDPGGDGATLHAVGSHAGPGCLGIVGGAAGGAGYIERDSQAATDNLAGNSFGDALACLAEMGTSGCPLEQPLEASWSALTAAHLQAQGDAQAGDSFLRPGALLVVLYLTDEDDCSAADDSLFDPARTDYGPLTSFRCTRAGVRWGDPPMPLPLLPTGGPLTAPSPAQDTGDGSLQPLSRYLQLFSGGALGIKDDPNDVVVAAFAGPAGSIELIATAPSVEPVADQSPCAGALDGVTCAESLRHVGGCVASSDASLFADPALRIAALVGALPNHYLAPICETDHGQALSDLGAMVSAREGGSGCITAPLLDPAHPDCLVNDVATDEGVPVAIPIAPCGSGVADPCWRVIASPSCAAVADPRTDSSASLAIEIERGLTSAPAGSMTTADCASYTTM